MLSSFTIHLQPPCRTVVIEMEMDTSQLPMLTVASQASRQSELSSFAASLWSLTSVAIALSLSVSSSPFRLNYHPDDDESESESKKEFLLRCRTGILALLFFVEDVAEDEDGDVDDSSEDALSLKPGAFKSTK